MKMIRYLLAISLLVAFSTANAQDEQEKVVFECQAGAWWTSGDEIVLTATMFPGMMIGGIDVAGTSHSTAYRVAGVNRRWDWGNDGDDSYNYAFVIEPDGTGLYYDFSWTEKGETTNSRQVFSCRRK